MKIASHIDDRQSIIRPGQRKAYVKGTRRQVEERLQAADLLLSLGYTKTKIHRVFRQRFNVEWRQTDRYLTRARHGRNSSTL